MATTKCIKCSVYRRERPAALHDLGDPTNGGVSYFHDELYLPHDQGPYDMDADDPRILRLVPFSRPEDGYKAVELHHTPTEGKTVGPMFGGNFLYGYYLFPCKHPVPIHDRWETPADYAANW